MPGARRARPCAAPPRESGVASPCVVRGLSATGCGRLIVSFTVASIGRTRHRPPNPWPCLSPGTPTDDIEDSNRERNWGDRHAPPKPDGRHATAEPPGLDSCAASSPPRRIGSMLAWLLAVALAVPDVGATLPVLPDAPHPGPRPCCPGPRLMAVPDALRERSMMPCSRTRRRAAQPMMVPVRQDGLGMQCAGPPTPSTKRSGRRATARRSRCCPSYRPQAGIEAYGGHRRCVVATADNNIVHSTTSTPASASRHRYTIDVVSDSVMARGDPNASTTRNSRPSTTATARWSWCSKAATATRCPSPAFGQLIRARRRSGTTRRRAPEIRRSGERDGGLPAGHRSDQRHPGVLFNWPGA